MRQHHLSVKDDIEDVSSELGNGVKSCPSWKNCPELYCSRRRGSTVSLDSDCSKVAVMVTNSYPKCCELDPSVAGEDPHGGGTVAL
ncbi:hypothetical protein TNCV_1573951 [Trichonephila clavipes]|nr:hypothetical protein TNCV_1573951 [Trichonephila clavipes]